MTIWEATIEDKSRQMSPSAAKTLLKQFHRLNPTLVAKQMPMGEFEVYDSEHDERQEYTPNAFMDMTLEQFFVASLKD